MVEFLYTAVLFGDVSSTNTMEANTFVDCQRNFFRLKKILDEFLGVNRPVMLQIRLDSGETSGPNLRVLGETEEHAVVVSAAG